MQKKDKCKLIYNPNAGKKRRLLPGQEAITLEMISYYLEQYQIPVDYAPTSGPGDATRLARESIKEGYKMVIAAGGDGTVSEVANGLVGTEMPLGILPLGTYMNIARMLSIPTDIEKAIMLIKIGRTRKIDVGKIVEMQQKPLQTPFYFLEGAGMGIEAQFQKHFLALEKGDLKELWFLLKTFIDYYGNKVTITLDEQEIVTRSILVTISNGPYTGAGLKLAPKAKLNDHLLTVSLYRMSKFELLFHLLELMRLGQRKTPKVVSYQSRRVTLSAKRARLIHADARFFGSTPITFEIVPNALEVITGYPVPGEDSSLLKRTYLSD